MGMPDRGGRAAWRSPCVGLLSWSGLAWVSRGPRRASEPACRRLVARRRRVRGAAARAGRWRAACTARCIERRPTWAWAGPAGHRGRAADVAAWRTSSESPAHVWSSGPAWAVAAPRAARDAAGVSVGVVGARRGWPAAAPGRLSAATALADGALDVGRRARRHRAGADGRGSELLLTRTCSTRPRSPARLRATSYPGYPMVDGEPLATTGSSTPSPPSWAAPDWTTSTSCPGCSRRPSSCCSCCWRRRWGRR